MVWRRLCIAGLTVVVLIELQIYTHKFNRSPDMLGYYLRRLVESKQAMRPPAVVRPNAIRDTAPLSQ